MRAAGIHHLVVHGASDHPVYLRIGENGVEIHDATPLWGKGVRETTRMLLDAARGGEVCCIGPAGENGVRFSNIMFSYYNSASRCGVGAVMGSKRLKGIAVLPARGCIRVADPEAFGQCVVEVRDALYRDTLSRQLFDFGTAADVDFFNELKASPAFNFQHSHMDDEEGVRRLSGRSWEPAGYLTHRRACSACILACHRFTEVSGGRFAGTYSGGPQLETVNALGPRCGNADVELVFRLSELCNDLGLDTSSTGTTIAWLMECWQRGALRADDVGAIKPEWGSEEALLQLVDLIARREGIGNLLADGTRAAAARVGRDTAKWAVQSKGLEITAVELRAAYSYALAFAVNPRGPDHLLSETMAEFGGTPEARAVMRKITGSDEYIGGTVLEKRAEIVRWHEDIYAVCDALGICAFASTAAYGVDEVRAARLFEAATGIAMGEAEIMRAGRRIVTLERCFNMREGLGRADDTIPWRFTHELQPDLAGAQDPLGRRREPIVEPEQLERMLDEYYALHGWDPTTGNPTSEGLRKLRLDFVLEGT
jgi:aldehyde:ferredoxin oxidoreductase